MNRLFDVFGRAVECAAAIAGVVCYDIVFRDMDSKREIKGVDYEERHPAPEPSKKRSGSARGRSRK